MFRQIADIVRIRIRSGEYPAGAVLPSGVSFGQEFGVSRTTIYRALMILSGEGLIEVIPSKGRVVTGGIPVLSYQYLRIIRDLTRQIRQGELCVGTRLPSEANLRRRYGVGRNTVRRALAVLEEDGWVWGSQGARRTVRRSL
ncbi:GntR family transcriptional regulator [Nonomuraea longicatena]|uniref:GntR family transcriptional regulator n=1 Tax=Nonomuraea longicatena TaxID=83682 RepID=UPI0031DE38F3